MRTLSQNLCLGSFSAAEESRAVFLGERWDWLGQKIFSSTSFVFLSLAFIVDIQARSGPNPNPKFRGCQKKNYFTFMISYDNFVHVLAGVAAVFLVLNALCEHIPF